MGSKHTPGPWAYDQDSGEVYFNDGDISPRIATIDDNWIDEAQGHADGALIAEAPAMLAALRKLVDHIRAIQSDGELEATTDGLGILFGDVMAEDVEGAEAILARIDGTSDQPELTQDNMGREFTCRACGREESECSAAPCEAVIADRKAI